MTKDRRRALRVAALRATSSVGDASWELQTSNSFRRIGGRGDGDVLCGTTHPRDHHVDLRAPSGVLEYVVAAQPAVVLALLERLDLIEARLVDVLGPMPDNVDERHHERACLCEVTPCPCPCHTLVEVEG